MKDVEFKSRIKSTNDYLLKLPEDRIPSGGMAVATFNQTAGKGQRGNKWISEPGCNICYSIIYHPEKIPAQNQFLISQAVALATRKFLSTYTSDITIKWPNDIFYKDKKIAGILIENRLTGSIIDVSVIGIGININQKSFPKEVPDAISLYQITGKEYSLRELTKKFHEILWDYLSELNLEKSDEIHRYYINNFYRRDGYHKYTDKDGTFSAKIAGVQAKGDLILELEDGSKRYYTFKEVQFSK